MPRLIVKCRYFNNRNSKRGGNYLQYIATRDGVDKPDDAWMNKKPTKTQEKVVAMILRDCPDTKNLEEYHHYNSSPTRGAASDFITKAFINHGELIHTKQTYLDYIATRPRAERFGTHGLFSDDGKTLVLSEESQKIREHKGNIWTLIISLSREDAQRLGFDHAERWRDFLRGNKQVIADGLKIPMTEMKWFGAFHNEKHHPHVHVVVYSNDIRNGYSTKQGIEKIRSKLANGIFAQDLEAVYVQQYERRKGLNMVAKEKVQYLINEIREHANASPQMLMLMTDLSEKLKSVKGKKQYGYLPRDIKQVVLSVADELEKDEKIRELYDLWYEKRYEVLKTYTDYLPPKLPLSKQKEFKSILNTIIREAKNLNVTDSGEISDIENKIDYVSAADVPEKESFKNHQDFSSGAAMLATTNMLYHLSNIFKNQFNGLYGSTSIDIDRKLKREIHEKRQAMGLK